MDQKQSIKIVTSTGDIEVNFYVTVDSTVTTQHIVITQNGTPIAHHSYDLNYPTGIHPASLDIWRRYERVRLGNLVIRSGFGLCGCYEYYDPYALPNPRHQESDTEHASGCVELIRSLEAYYPDLLTPELYRRAKHLLKDHDLGENEYGDRPDDGSQNRSEKTRPSSLDLRLLLHVCQLISERPQFPISFVFRTQLLLVSQKKLPTLSN